MTKVQVYKQAEPTLPVAEPILLRLVEQPDGSVCIQEVHKRGYTVSNVAVINENGIRPCASYTGRIAKATNENKARILA